MQRKNEKIIFLLLTENIYWDFTSLLLVESPTKKNEKIYNL